MAHGPLHVVTGAFGYSGSYIAGRLLAQGMRVRTLTNSPLRPNMLQGQIEAHPFDFNQPDLLVESLRGAAVLFNTYWVRFNAGDFDHSTAIQNTQILFQAARKAGVKKIVHVSITNPSEDSPLEYFHGKAVLEKALCESGLSYAILRPAVLFGGQDILINNIAWMLRHFPVFGVFGDGNYRLQPIYVDDLAALAVEQGENQENVIINAVGPETFTYRNLVKTICSALGISRPILSIPPWLGYTVGWMVGQIMGDMIVTKPEIRGLMDELLYVDDAPTGTTALSRWATDHASTLGKHYANEMSRRLDRRRDYRQ